MKFPANLETLVNGRDATDLKVVEFMRADGADENSEVVGVVLADDFFCDEFGGDVFLVSGEALKELRNLLV